MAIIYGKKITTADVKELETNFKVNIPEDYKLFLLEKNGMFINGDNDFVHINYDGVDDGIDIDRLYGIKPKRNKFDLHSKNRELLCEIKFIDNAIIIGSDAGGNFYVLVTTGKNSGIYYWDRTHLHEYDIKKKFYFEEVDECGRLYYIYSNFSELYKNIIKSLPMTNVSKDVL